jgi:hypothetical protein
MAIALEHANIGTNGADPGSLTIAFTTTQTVVAGSFIVVSIGGFVASGTTVTVANTGSSVLSWTTNKQGNPASPSACLTALASAQAPSGLTSGATITATYSASTAARQIGGTSFTGVATSSPVDTTTGPTGVVDLAPWSTASTSIQAGSLLVATCYTETGARTNTPDAGSTEALDWQNAASPTTQTTCYRVESSAGSYVVSGAWVGGIARSGINGVAYLAGVAAPPDIEEGFAAPAGMFSPTLVEKGWWH